MSEWESKFERYCAVWRSKGEKKTRRELESYQKRLSRYADTFYHKTAPDELSDGDRVMALREVLREYDHIPDVGGMV